MSTLSITRADYRLGVLILSDGQTLEGTAYAHPLTFGDEFWGAKAAVPAAGAGGFGSPWVKKIVGAAPPTVAGASGVDTGTIVCALTSTSEAQEATLYFDDYVVFDTSKIGLCEWRARLTALPTGVASAFVGVGSAWVGGPLNTARYAGFYWAGNGSLKIVSKDGSGNTYNFAAAPIAGSAIVTDITNFHTYRIEFGVGADLAFYVDGNRVNAVGSVVWSPSSAANAIAQPFSTVYKGTATTDVGTLTVEKLDMAANR
jgi:hypothetical protein